MNSQQSFCMSLGGHVVGVEGDEVAFFTNNEAYTRFATDAAPQWVVRFGCDVSLPSEQATLLNSFVFQEINSRCLFHVDGDLYSFTMLPDGEGSPLAIMSYRRGSSVVESTLIPDRNALRFAMWFAVGLLATPSRLTFVHSSTIVHQGKAVLFLGESGTGKSTHTRLWLNHIDDARLLNDDSPMIRLFKPKNRDGVHANGEQDLLVAYGSPWSGKTPCFVPRSFPVAAIVRLSQAPYNAIHRLSTTRAFAAIHPSLPPALAQDDYYTDYLMEILSGIISSVPVYHLECLPDADAARLSCNTIFPANG